MSRTWGMLAAAGLLGAILFFATDKLTETPPTWFDEGVYLQTAMNDTLYGQEELQVAPGNFAPAAYVTGGYPFLKPISWSFDAFGIGILQARAVMVVFILAMSAVFFGLLHALFGLRTALFSLLLLALFPPLYGQGKNVLGEVPGLFFLGVFLFSTYQLEKKRFVGPWWYVLAGFSSGLCVASKPIFLLLGPAVLIVAVLRRRSINFEWRQLTAAFIAFLIPVSIWYVLQFSKADSLGQILGYYSNPYGIQDLNKEMLTNALRFFHESSPMYFFFLMLVWSVSVILAFRSKKKISVTECVAWAFALLVSVAYLRTAGWYRYFFVAEIPALLFIIPALMRLQQVVPARIPKNEWITGGVVAILVLIQGYQLFFGSWVAQHSARTTSHDLQSYFATLPKSSSFFVYNSPASVIFLQSQNYYQYLELNPHVALGKERLALIQEGATDYLVMSSSRWYEASSSMSLYKLAKTIDDVAIASRISP